MHTYASFTATRVALTLSLFLTAIAASGIAQAHTVWLADGDASGHYLLLFGGHEGRTEPYDAAKLGALQAFDARGQALGGAQAARVAGSAGFVPGRAGPLRVEAPGAAMLTVSFDNGFWSKGPDGRSVNRPMNEVPGAVSGTHAMKFHKRILTWSVASARPVGQPFELLPRSADAPAAGEPLALQVLIDGRPAPGIWLAFGEAGRGAQTDAQGIASLPTRPGRNTIWAGRRTPVQGDPATTELSIEYSLVFDAR